MQPKHTYPSVMTVAGFDGSGGAGIQGDIKTVSALGCFATSVLTALPIQNTQGVQDIFPIPHKTVEDQMVCLLDDILPDAIKIGMVHTTELVNTIVSVLGAYPSLPIVFDPVMVSTSGHRLIHEDTVQAIVAKLFPLAEVITPNMDEASVLVGSPVKTLDDMHEAGRKIMQMGCRSVLLKGGHLNTNRLTSLFFTRDNKIHVFEHDKYDTRNMHGSGCTLSSAIAAYRARKYELLQAVSEGQNYVHKAIYHGRDVQIGKGNGPLNHFFHPHKLIKNEMV